jgi:hypothetical protein
VDNGRFGVALLITSRKKKVFEACYEECAIFRKFVKREKQKMRKLAFRFFVFFRNRLPSKEVWMLLAELHNW